MATTVGFIALAGVAAERIAALMVWGMITAPLLSMLVIPAAYLLTYQRRRAD